MSRDSEEARVLSTTSRFGALALVVSLTLAVTAAACRSSGDSAKDPSGWRDFVVVPDAEDSAAVGSIEEMERIARFAFVFPSYMPEGMDNRVMLRAWAQADWITNGVAEQVGASEEVIILGRRPDSPHIAIGEMTQLTITEMAQPLSVDFPDWTNETEHVNIAETDVGCEASPAPNNDPLKPMLTCDWLVGEMGFEVYLLWAVEKAIPGYVTEDMRQEALKVIESMIVAPEHP